MKGNPKKVRVDILLLEQGLFPSRIQAQKAVMAGRIRANKDRVVLKCNELWDSETIFADTKPFPYVSRGAAKIVAALDKYVPNLENNIGLDIGASTGGFTDAMLQRGADLVYAVDVGHGQLHYRLRQDPRVVVLEKVNARYLARNQIPTNVDIMAMDVSFISTKKVLPTVSTFLNPNSWIFVLIKPQFEAKRYEVSKGGIVKSQLVRDRVKNEIQLFVVKELGWSIVEMIDVSVEAKMKNIETMAVFRNLDK